MPYTEISLIHLKLSPHSILLTKYHWHEPQKNKDRPSANNLAVKDSLSVNMLSYQYRPKTTTGLEEKACANICP